MAAESPQTRYEIDQEHGHADDAAVEPGEMIEQRKKYGAEQSGRYQAAHCASHRLCARQGLAMAPGLARARGEPDEEGAQRRGESSRARAGGIRHGTEEEDFIG